MRAKLLMKIKIMKDEKVVDCNFTKGKIYEIKNSDFFFYYIHNDLGVLCRLSKDLFEIVEEDKMEQVKTVRKLEDLDGNTSKCGEFVLNYYKTTKSAEIIFKGDKNIAVTEICEESFKIYTETRNLLKKLGFEFEYKPLRTVEEVLEEIRKNGKSFCCENDFVVSYTKKHGWSAVTLGRDVIGNCYFREDIANAYVRELNEIIGADKK